MKKILLSSFVLILLFTQTTISSCTKTVTNTDTVTVTVIDTVTLYPIQGLWVGTYTSSVNSNMPYYFSFTVYPDGSLTYKSDGANNTTFNAFGTWTLTGSSFSFSVVVTGSGDTQTGSATYDSIHGTLTNGTVSDASTGVGGTWTMSKVN